jgi:hypothetical protein
VPGGIDSAVLGVDAQQGRLAGCGMWQQPDSASQKSLLA